MRMLSPQQTTPITILNKQSMENKRLNEVDPYQCLWTDEDAFTL